MLYGEPLSPGTRLTTYRAGRSITLFHRPKTRATRFIFLLEELKAPYTVHTVTTRNRDGGGAADPANPHPHGKVPAISDDGVVVFESPAIALYLTDKFPKNQCRAAQRRDAARHVSLLARLLQRRAPEARSRLTARRLR